MLRLNWELHHFQYYPSCVEAQFPRIFFRGRRKSGKKLGKNKKKIKLCCFVLMLNDDHCVQI